MLKDPVTEALRLVFERAEEEAGTRGSAVLYPEHLLLALTRDAGQPAGQLLAEAGVSVESVERALEAPEAEALAALGISLEEVRERAEETFGADAWTEATRHTGKIRRSREATATVQQAAQEAWTLGDRHFGTEHLLLGLLAHGGRTATLLDRLGVSPLFLHAQLRERLGRVSGGAPTPATGPRSQREMR